MTKISDKEGEYVNLTKNAPLFKVFPSIKKYPEIVLDHLESFRLHDTARDQSQEAILTGSRPGQRLNLLLLVIMISCPRIRSLRSFWSIVEAQSCDQLGDLAILLLLFR